jgi:hypothetical protein
MKIRQSTPKYGQYYGPIVRSVSFWLNGDVSICSDGLLLLHLLMNSGAQLERPAKDEAGSEVSDRQIQAALHQQRAASDANDFKTSSGRAFNDPDGNRCKIGYSQEGT